MGSHVSSSQRPLLHHAIGYNMCMGLGREFVEGCLAAGADPSAPDAFGVQPLALCALHVDPSLGAELWEVLVGAGADPGAPMASTRLGMGGIAGGSLASVADRDGAATAWSILAGRPAEGIVLARSERREVAGAALAAAGSAAPRRL